MQQKRSKFVLVYFKLFDIQSGHTHLSSTEPKSSKQRGINPTQYQKSKPDNRIYADSRRKGGVGLMTAVCLDVLGRLDSGRVLSRELQTGGFGPTQMLDAREAQPPG